MPKLMRELIIQAPCRAKILLPSFLCQILAKHAVHIGVLIFILTASGKATSSATTFLVSDQWSLREISILLYGNTSKWKELADYNGIKDPNKFYQGRSIKLKTPATISIQEGRAKLLDMWRKRFPSPPIDTEIFQQNAPEIPGTFTQNNPPEPEKIEEAVEPLSPTRKFKMFPSLGVSFYNLYSPQKTAITELNADAAINGEWPISSERWELGGRAQLTLFSPHVWAPQTQAIRALYGDAWLSYRVSDLQGTWKTRFQAGTRGSRTFGKPDQIGYNGVFGPSLGLVAEHNFSNQAALVTSFKVGGIINGTELLSLSSRDLYASVQYFLPPVHKGFLRGQQLYVSANASWLRVSLNGGSFNANMYLLEVGMKTF